VVEVLRVLVTQQLGRVVQVLLDVVLMLLLLLVSLVLRRREGHDAELVVVVHRRLHVRIHGQHVVRNLATVRHETRAAHHTHTLTRSRRLRSGRGKNTTDFLLQATINALYLISLRAV
jgi:hypothetical protein